MNSTPDQPAWPRRPVAIIAYPDNVGLVVRRAPSREQLAALDDSCTSARLIRSRHQRDCLHLLCEMPRARTLSLLDEIVRAGRGATLSRVELSCDFVFPDDAEARRATDWVAARVLAHWGRGYFRRSYKTNYFGRGDWRSRTLALYPKGLNSHFDLRLKGSEVCRAAGLTLPSDLMHVDIADRVLASFSIGTVDVVAVGRAAFRDRGRAGVPRAEAFARGLKHCERANHLADEPVPHVARCQHYFLLKNWPQRLIKRTAAKPALTPGGVITIQTLHFFLPRPLVETLTDRTRQRAEGVVNESIG